MRVSNGSTHGWTLLGLVGVFSLALGGCGEAPTPPTPAPKPAAEAPTPAPAKAGAKGKIVDPTINMDRDELRAHKKKLREEGKSL